MADTSQLLSEPLVASMAAGLLDEFHINSLDDNSTVGRFMAREFGVVRDEVLEGHPWHFAKSRIVLEATGTPPAFGWQYQYQLPDGCLRAIPPNIDGTHSGKPIPHEIESTMLLCNVGPKLNLIWIRRETNMAKWPALAARAFACKMAVYAAQRVTGKAQYFDKARNAFNDAIFEAKLVDGQTRGNAESVYSSGANGFDSISVRGRGF